MARRLCRIAVCLWLIGLLLPTGVAAGRAPGGDAFYDPPSNLQFLDPGAIIRAETRPSEVASARMWRILYVSTTSNGDRVAVSALLVAPVSPPPADGYSLIAVGHGSVGTGQGCAPSIDPYGSSLNSPSSYDLFVDPLVRAGYVVVMSDYQGLGVPGPSSFLVGELEGRDILDAARASFSFPELHLQPGLVIWGHSQGGHAALFAGHLAPDYAPELSVAGLVAEAPAADLGAMYAQLLDSNDRGGIVSLPLMTIDAWAGEYPEINLDAVLTGRGRDVLEKVIRPNCLTAAYFLTQPYRPSDLIRPGALERLRVYVEANTPPFGPYAMPVLIVQGEADETVPAELTRRFVDGMCESGTHVTYRSFPGAGHIEVIDAARDVVLAWLQTVRGGVMPPSTCGQ